MNQQNDQPTAGVLREEKEFVRDYRQRAFRIGTLQFYVSLGYLLLAYYQARRIQILTSFFNITVATCIESNNQTFGTLDVNTFNYVVESVASKFYFWIVVNVTRAFLHILSSLLIVWATEEDVPKLRAMRFCNSARIMNVIFLLYEIVVVVVMYQEWKIASFFVLYRIWFSVDAHGLLNQIKVSS